MIGWLDCASGASGDMLLGALASAGVPGDVMASAAAAALPAGEGVAVEFVPVRRGGFAALHACVDAPAAHVHRTWANIRDLVTAAALRDDVRTRALATFRRLAEAEGRVHGMDPEEVHFHEVGALDAIADVMGACAGFAHLGLASLSASPVALGGGTVQTSHGSTGVPAPAVAELLREVPTYGGPVEAELCTPTGAALLLEWVDAWGPQPAMAVSTVGVGAGWRELDAHPNVLRLLLGTPAAAPPPSQQGAPGANLRSRGHTTTETTGRMFETNVDDLDPRLWPGILTRLLDAGASDAWLTPILMKKGRPAHTLSVLVDTEHAEAVRGVLFQETSTLGIREYDVHKHALQRREETVEVDGRPLRVKLAVYDGEVINVQPEFDDVTAVAAATGRPAKSVLADAITRARDLR